MVSAFLSARLFGLSKTWRRVALFSACFLLAGRYLWWRAADTIAPFGQTLDCLASWSLLALEGAALAGSLSAFGILTRTRDRSGEVAANLGWSGFAPRPKLAIPVATCNEENQVLERTVGGALALQYPNALHVRQRLAFGPLSQNSAPFRPSRRASVPRSSTSAFDGPRSGPLDTAAISRRPACRCGGAG